MMRSAATALALLFLAGCNDDDPSASVPVDPIQVLKQAHVRDLATALTQAYEQFDRRNFDACIAFCNYVLSREPEYWVARDFACNAGVVRARLAEGDEFYFSVVMAKLECWKKSTSFEVPNVPYQEDLSYPHLGLLQEPTPTNPRTDAAAAPDPVHEHAGEQSDFET